MSFTDDHCHVLPTGLDLAAVDLSSARSPDDCLRLLRESEAEGPFLLAHHYDPNRWGGEELTAARLAAFAKPTILRHSNGHAGVANALALAAAGIGPTDADPVGGTFGRDADGRIDGRLVEKALERVMEGVPTPSEAEMVRAIRLATESMASFGIRAAIDMQTGRFDLGRECRAYAEATIDVRLCVEWDAVFGPTGVGPDEVRRLAGDRLFGIKLFADGAIGSASAAVHEPYLTTGETGLLIYPPDELIRRVRVASDAGFRVVVHAIGDRAVDLVLDAFEATGRPSAHRMEHAMILSDAQIERIARLGVPISTQPEFLAAFRTTYVRQLGEARADRLIRVRSLLDAGVTVTFSSDRPIVPGDPRTGIAAAVNHPSPTERIDEATAVRLYGG